MVRRRRKHKSDVLFALIIAAIMVMLTFAILTAAFATGVIGQPSPSPIPTPTISPSPTPTWIGGPTPTPTPTRTPTPTPTRTPTPTPTPSPTSTPNPAGNLAQLPNYVTSYWGLGSYACLSYPVTHLGQQCMMLSRDQNYINNLGYQWTGIYELDGKWENIKPGQHIIFSAYISTDQSTIGDTNGASGHGFCRMSIDMYGANGRIVELNTASGTSSNLYGGVTLDVHWGTNSWVHYTQEFTVPSTYESDGYNPPGGYTAGQTATPTSFTAWFAGYGMNTNEAAHSYIYGTELYITGP